MPCKELQGFVPKECYHGAGEPQKPHTPVRESCFVPSSLRKVCGRQTTVGSTRSPPLAPIRCAVQNLFPCNAGNPAPYRPGEKTTQTIESGQCHFPPFAEVSILRSETDGLA